MLKKVWKISEFIEAIMLNDVFASSDLLAFLVVLKEKVYIFLVPVKTNRKLLSLIPTVSIKPIHFFRNWIEFVRDEAGQPLCTES